MRINKDDQRDAALAFVFIMPVVSLYMFRVLFAPIIRSV